MRKKALLLVLALLMAFPAGAQAAEDGEPAFDGYLLRLREDAAVLLEELPEGVEPVDGVSGVFYAATLEDAAWFHPEALAYLEPNYVVQLLEAEAQDWNMTMMGTDAARLAGLDGAGARIGVVDSGVYGEHEALAGARILPGWNYVGKSEDTGDTLGHGTVVTSIIAAAAPGAEIVPLKCFEGKNGSVMNIISAIRSGVNQYGCEILNMSFGLSEDSIFLRQAVEYAAERGVIMTAAVGNNGAETLNYPAAYEEVTGVGMVDEGKTVSELSQHNQSVYVTAPGQGIRCPDIEAPDKYRDQPGSGTSFACPHVSAAAALMRQALPELTAEEFRTALREGAEDLGEPGYDEYYGYGLLSVERMLLALPLTPVREGDALRVRLLRTEAAEGLRAWAASYGPEGRMLSCCALETKASGALAGANGALPYPSGAAEVRVFFLWEEGMGPVREAEGAEISGAWSLWQK